MDTTKPDTAESAAPIKLLVQYRSEPGMEWGKYIVGVQFGLHIVDLPLMPATPENAGKATGWAEEKLKTDDTFRRNVNKRWAEHVVEVERRELENQQRAAEWQRRWEAYKPRSEEEIRAEQIERQKIKDKSIKWLKKNGEAWFGQDLQNLIDEYIKHRSILSAMENEILKRRKKYTHLTNFYEGGIRKDKLIKAVGTSAAKLKRMSQVADHIEIERKFYDKI